MLAFRRITNLLLPFTLPISPPSALENNPFCDIKNLSSNFLLPPTHPGKSVRERLGRASALLNRCPPAPG
ncbi:hypothetical protein PGTUg99_010273 [Puccinia graminis f. sp. tritici]|uniref:Uncharacterized protein n=1 Tax=Puccinia graminis f. sp. tritici TaxID=56615 RepID=A0A5B0M1E9_PUCGR|nr:hypothetical protein PGTUg99_010273 [Puccinia graminis f. sp. tritici]